MRKPKIAAGDADAAVKPADRALACAASHVWLSWGVNTIQTAGPGENVSVLKVRNNSRHACTGQRNPDHRPAHPRFRLEADEAQREEPLLQAEPGRIRLSRHQLRPGLP
jgi:hypothetical protein